MNQNETKLLKKNTQLHAQVQFYQKEFEQYKATVKDRLEGVIRYMMIKIKK